MREKSNFWQKNGYFKKHVMARCAILLNIYGKKDCFDVSSHDPLGSLNNTFISCEKRKPTYLSDCENSGIYERIFCRV